MLRITRHETDAKTRVSINRTSLNDIRHAECDFTATGAAKCLLSSPVIRDCDAALM